MRPQLILAGFFAGMFCTIIGIIIGGWLEAVRWRANADAIQRIESDGQLYKVEYADDPKPEGTP